ncbi:hypothetical protein LAZ67_22000259 [Cordylochernes scorpioides]|uniref:Integrase catalytic domain-containing protein n=1 Tax=Cordylochernes scorpioides TaxID=51811 RepID=A0ABY6LN35_9ARAC|nr:hypothetical protein LAZ67_22000259 [Cordylochernes scorpioides]
MAENCNYGSLKEEMIRDRKVVGVKNLQLSEKLQLEPNLTLERAIQAACQTECVKQQQTILRSTTTQAANVDQVYEKRLPSSRFNSTFGKRDASKKSKFQKWSKPEKSGCIRCGASKFHPYKDCPAKEVKCHKCKKVGHFAKVYYNKTLGQVTQGDDYHFVGNIYENGQNTNDWKVYVKVDKIKILFKMDTGADVNIIPEEVRSDNGPQFGLEFKKFAKEYGFHHITSSPRFPQSNGFIESMMKNIKNQLKKGRDPYLSLLGYRTAPLENGYSPAELCMNRKLRTTVPISPVQLQSRIPALENLEMREKNQRHKKKTHFDIHHRARELPHLDEGTRVWVKDLRVPGVVLEDAGSPRSYIVNSPKGILRRNRLHLLPNPQGEKIDMEDEEMESPEMSQCFTSTGDNTTCDSEPRTFQRSPEPVKTRSGRVIKPPDRLNL